MASPSSQPKRARQLDPDHVRLLLEDGARIENPASALMATADALQSMGMISFSLGEYVKCHDPRDRDFSGGRQPCHGQIVIDPGKDEDAEDYECPRCRRIVYPARHHKNRHPLVQTHLQRPGALRWLHARLKEIDTGAKDTGDGTFHVPAIGPRGVSVCVADADGLADGPLNRRSVAASTPVLYVVLAPHVPVGRLVKDDWLCRVGLLDLVCGNVDLRQALEECAAAGPPQHVAAVDVPVYAKGHVLVQPEEAPHVERLFCVEVDASTVRVNGEIVVNPQAGPRLALFGILWKQFIADLLAQKPVDAFGAMNMKKLLKAMSDAGHSYGDETSLRKLINNLQNDIETAVKKKLGLPIGREDIVQTCKMQGQADTSGGYRINPTCVAIRPSQPR
jgi:hypothetical protein